jgi:hypothetical protein
MSSKNVNSFSTIDTINTYSNSSLLGIVSGNLTRLTSGNLVLNKVNASNLIYNTGNQIKSGRLIIGHSEVGVVDPNSPYTLSIQSNYTNTWLEILNDSGHNQGVFFGIDGNDFEQYNWQGGDIIFYTAENPSQGINRLAIKNNGNIGIGTNIPSEKLEVDGNILANNLVYNTGNQTISGVKTFDVFPVVSGNKLITGVDLSSYATTANLASTGSTLTNSINSLSGTLTSTYATINNLASTGSTLQSNISSTGSSLDNKIGSLSGTLTSTYATISNLANTGSTLNTRINDLSGYVNTQDTTISNNLTTTGITLNNKINSLSGSSVLLYGNQSIGGVKTFRDNVYINNLFVTGTETIVSTNNFNVQSPYILLNLTGGAVDGGIFFVTGAGLTGINDPGPIIGFDHINKFKFGISTRSSDLSTLPDIASVQDIQAYSGFVDGKYATIVNLASTGSTLDTKINNLSGYSNNTFSTITNLALTGSTLTTNLASTGSTLNSSINSLSGTLTSNYATITNLASTGSTLQTNINNLSGYINSSNSNIVFTTGNQTISGNKTFIGQTLITGKSDGFVGESITLVGGNGAGFGGDITLIGGIGSAITDGLVNVNASIAVNRGTNKNSFTDFYKSGDAGNSYLSISKDQIQIKNGATLLVSGVPVTPSLYATSTNLASTGNTLVTNLASTGSTLVNTINSLSGTLTSTYATIANLASTGSTLNTRINNLSGYINSTSSNIVFTTGDQSIAGNKTLTNKLNITASATNDSTLKVGTLELQPYTVNNAWFGDNTYYNGAFYRREAGYAGAFYFQGPEGQFRFADTDNAGTTYTPAVQLKTHLDGRFGVGSNISTATADFTNSNFFVDSTDNGSHVGLGTITPAEKLHVAGNLKLDGNYIYIYDTANDANNYIYWNDGEIVFNNNYDGPNPGLVGFIFNFGPLGENVLYSNRPGALGTYLTIPSGKTDYIALASEVVNMTGNQTISGVKTFIGNHNIIGNTTITGNLNVSGMIRTPQQNKKFVYNPIVTGGGNGTGTIAYGANCTLTPRYVGTLRADAAISMWGLNGSSLDTVQATSFWYGTGTAPVYSGNLVNLGGTRIGGYKTLPSIGRAVNTASDQPIGTSWVAEITGLNTGTQYWFDIGISGSNGRLRVQDVQLYIEEKY